MSKHACKDLLKLEPAEHSTSYDIMHASNRAKKKLQKDQKFKINLAFWMIKTFRQT